MSSNLDRGFVDSVEITHDLVTGPSSKVPGLEIEGLKVEISLEKPTGSNGHLQGIDNGQDDYQGKYDGDYALETSLGVTDGSIQQEGCIVIGEEMQRMAIDGMGSGDLALADAASGEIITDMNSVEKHDIFMPDGGSAEVEIKGKGDLVTSSPCLTSETETAVPCLLDGDSMEKENSVVENPVFVEETSKPFIAGNQDLEALPHGVLAKSLGAGPNEVEPSLGGSQMDVENPPSPDEVELVQRSEAEDNVQIGEEELMESFDLQIPQDVKVTPWTLCSESNRRVHYNLPLQDTSEFSVSDLVWGKVKSHPWWPGQIFAHSAASELALKYQRKEKFLVAYFGDKTFAWRDEDQLKTFYANFSQMEKQRGLDPFRHAVGDALGEVSRRMELGMACSCLPQEEKIDTKCPRVENAGILEGTKNSFFDRSLVVNYFDHNRLLDYIKALAEVPTGEADRLELAIAKAQLKAFYCLKGYPELPEFIYGRGLMENDVEGSSCHENPKEFALDHSTPMPSEFIPGKRRGRPPKGQKQISNDVEHSTQLSAELTSGKRTRGRQPMKQNDALGDVEVSVSRDKKAKHFSVEHSTQSSLDLIPGKRKKGRPPKKGNIAESDSANLGKIKKTRSDLLGNSAVKSASPIGGSFEIEDCIHDSAGSKRKSKDSVVDLENKPQPPTPNSSFKVGEYIRRVASQLRASSPKSDGDTVHKRVSKFNHVEGEVDPDAFPSAPVLKRRKKVAITKDLPPSNEMLSQLCSAARDPLKGYSSLSMVVSFFTNFRKASASNSLGDSKLSMRTGGKRGCKTAAESESDSSDMSKPDHMKDSYWSDIVSVNNKQRKRKSAGQPLPPRFLGSIRDTALIISVEEKIVDTPTALVLNFNSSNSLPSEADLIRIFSRYGPLRESETEVMRKTNRVKVVFKRRAHAEVAFSSAGKFSIFGPALLSYQLKYLKNSPVSPPQGENDTAPVEGGTLEASGQAETGVESNTAAVEAVGND